MDRVNIISQYNSRPVFCCLIPKLKKKESRKWFGTGFFLVQNYVYTIMVHSKWGSLLRNRVVTPTRKKKKRKKEKKKKKKSPTGRQGLTPI